MSLPVIHNLDQQPDAIRSIKSYERLATEYDCSCTRIENLRLRAIEALALQSGETVLDVACGTGSALPLLAEKVDSHGRVIGIEHSPEMAQQASVRIKSSGKHATVVVAGMADPVHVYAADAVLMCYTQDVLQSSDALDQLLKACKPGARIVILGMKTLPWLWGWPVNVFNMYRARNYMTTYNNLDHPYRLLEQHGAKLSTIHTALWGSAYIAAGYLPG
jgi:ubiquinone/menaquinone biosynthesis C-methylase UbiE